MMLVILAVIVTAKGHTIRHDKMEYIQLLPHTIDIRMMELLKLVANLNSKKAVYSNE